MFLSQALKLCSVTECAQPSHHMVVTVTTMGKMKKLRPSVIQLHSEATELGLALHSRTLGVPFCSYSSSGVTLSIRV